MRKALLITGLALQHIAIRTGATQAVVPEAIAHYLCGGAVKLLPGDSVAWCFRDIAAGAQMADCCKKNRKLVSEMGWAIAGRMA